MTFFHEKPPSTGRRGCWDLQRCSGPVPARARYFYRALLTFVFFFLSQLLICLFELPFWACDSNFPGQIVAMVSVWLFLWVLQAASSRLGKGLERIYHEYLKPSVS